MCLSVLPLVPGFADLPGDLELLVGPAFLFRSLDRRWEISLKRATLESCARRFHMTEIGLEDEVGRLALLVPVGGPGPEELEGIFSSAPVDKSL